MGSEGAARRNRVATGASQLRVPPKTHAAVSSARVPLAALSAHCCTVAWLAQQFAAKSFLFSIVRP